MKKKWRHLQTLDDFKVGMLVEWRYQYDGGWRFKYLHLKGTVVGFTKHQVRVEFDKGQRFERQTVPPTRLEIKESP